MEFTASALQKSCNESAIASKLPREFRFPAVRFARLIGLLQSESEERIYYGLAFQVIPGSYITIACGYVASPGGSANGSKPLHHHIKYFTRVPPPPVMGRKDLDLTWSRITGCFHTVTD